MSNNPVKPLDWIILLALAFTWGSSFILMKRGLEVYTPAQVASIRIFVAFLVLLPVALPHIRKAFTRNGLAIFSVGFLGNFIPAFLFTRAQTGLSSSLTGMLNSLTPLFTLILGVAFFRIRVSGLNIVGIFVGLAGAMGLIVANPGSTIEGSFSFAVYVIIATVLYATSVNIIKRYLQDVSSVTIASLAFVFIGPVAGVFLFSTDFYQVLTSHPGAIRALLFVIILAVVGTAISVIVFNMLIKRTSALFGSSVTYMIPVFAMMWGLFDGEMIPLLQWIFVGVILCGIYLVNLRPTGIKSK